MIYHYTESYAGNDKFAVLMCPMCGNKDIENGNFKEYKYKCKCCGSNFNRLSYGPTKTIKTEILTTKDSSIKDSTNITEKDIGWKPIVICELIFVLICIFIAACITHGVKRNDHTNKYNVEKVQSQITYQTWTCSKCGCEFDERYYDLESIKDVHTCYILEDTIDWGPIDDSHN